MIFIHIEDLLLVQNDFARALELPLVADKLKSRRPLHSQSRISAAVEILFKHDAERPLRMMIFGVGFEIGHDREKIFLDRERPKVAARDTRRL